MALLDALNGFDRYADRCLSNSFEIPRSPYLRETNYGCCRLPVSRERAFSRDCRVASGVTQSFIEVTWSGKAAALPVCFERANARSVYASAAKASDFGNYLECPKSIFRIVVDPKYSSVRFASIARNFASTDLIVSHSVSIAWMACDAPGN